MRISDEFIVETGKSIEETERAMRALEPWRIAVKFSNGFETASLRTIQPWSAWPLNKLKIIGEMIGEDVFERARVLDIGFNAGYNSITLAQVYDAEVVGIDNDPRNLEKAEALAAIAGVKPEFRIADATDFVDEPFDIVLHLGTLYHLRDPIKAMRTAARNTRPGGHLFLETASYEGRDPLDARLIHGLGGDKSNYWAIGLGAIELILTDAGFGQVRLLRKYELKIYEGTGLNRVLIHARR